MRIKSLDPQTKVKLDSLKTVRLARRAAFDSVRQLSEKKRSINIRLINERSVDRDSIFTALYSGSEGSQTPSPRGNSRGSDEQAVAGFGVEEEDIVSSESYGGSFEEKKNKKV